MAEASNQTVLQMMSARGVKSPARGSAPYQQAFDAKLLKSVMNAPYTLDYRY
jgi:hypothetical protein